MYIRQKRWVFLPMILLAALLLSGSAWARRADSGGEFSGFRVVLDSAK